VPDRPLARRNDLYVTRATRPAAVRKRVASLFDERGFRTVHVHAMGAAIGVCVDMALTLHRIYGKTLLMEAKTGSVEIVDDYFPLKAVRICICFTLCMGVAIDGELALDGFTRCPGENDHVHH